jgi:hypothetical protein
MMDHYTMSRKLSSSTVMRRLLLWSKACRVATRYSKIPIQIQPSKASGSSVLRLAEEARLVRSPIETLDYHLAR